MRINLSYIFLCMIVISSCTDSKETVHEYFSKSFLDSLGNETTLVDSITLSDDFNFFNHKIYTDKFYDNTILASQRRNLSVSLLDTTGYVLEKITQVGEGPGLLGNVQDALYTVGTSGRIYVLATGNAYTLHVFSPNLHFIKSLPIFKLLSTVFVPPVGASLSVIEKNDNTFLVTFSTGSTVYPSDSQNYFENAYSIAQFLIDSEDFDIIQSSEKLPLKNLSQVKTAMKNHEFNWESSTPVFDYENGQFYVIYPFSDQILVYDQDFILLNKISLDKISSIPNKGFYQKIETNNNDFFTRTLLATRVRRENINIKSIDVYESVVIVRFPEVFREGSYPLPTKNEIGKNRSIGYSIHQHILYKNLITKEEKLITWPEGHYSTNFTNEKTLLVHYLPNTKEKALLLKYELIK